ncbi:hypothetical protein EUX98_g4565 [Antrodiella citrinella]|uniref:RRM domain-containing protein n=1 Tax=Antrodiella citrinella TaxID=2447956 RepID=A0A4S4N1N7_9APHY|nr:hypothetical protein EUX98_g4565 [Antrodiella citrinella]
MDHTLHLPVPFPTLARPLDEARAPFIFILPSLLNAFHCSPKRPTITRPSTPACIPLRRHPTPGASRPLTVTPQRDLSLNAHRLLSYPKSKKKLSVTSSGSPRRSHVPLTPPLTPSSSFNSASGNEASDRDNDAESTVPSTPPESPLRAAAWNAANGKRMTFGNFGNVYMSPVSGDSDISSSDLPRRRMSSVGSASPAGSVDSVTPRMEKTFKLDDSHAEDPSQLASRQMSTRALEILTTFKGLAEPSRFVLLRNIPSQTSRELLQDAFYPSQQIKGVLVRYQQHYGVIVLAFFDVEQAEMARGFLDGKLVADVLHMYRNELTGQQKIEAIFVNQDHVVEVAGVSNFVASTSGMFYVTIEGRSLAPESVRNLLSGYGDLIEFCCLESSEYQHKFRVEYKNERKAQVAYSALKQRSMFGAVVRTYRPGEDAESNSVNYNRVANGPGGMVFGQTEVDLTSPARNNIALPEEYERRPRSVSAGEGAHDGSRAHPGQRDMRGRVRERDASLSPQEEFGARMRGMHPPPSPSRRRSNSLGPEPERSASIPPPQAGFPPGIWPVAAGADPNGAYAYEQHVASMNPYASQFTPGIPNPAYHMGIPPSTPQLFHAPPPQQLMQNDGFMHPVMPHHAGPEIWQQAYPHVPPGLQHPQMTGGMKYFLPPPPADLHHSPPRTAFAAQNGPEHCTYAISSTTPHRSSYAPRTPVSPTSPIDAFTASFASLNTSAPGDTAQKNQLDLAAIEKGIDTRTTVMVKNIPNKMTDKDLLDFISKVCPRRIDFLYLRMDFQNGCNVGYAFVNFITVQDLLHFASTQLGVKWNMYSSEKYLQLSYANYQGKEALVEKFKNSCIMDEREAWRPKIFYSSGPNEGMPEPFPSPTHLRRKERSAHNRGALFVPGPGSQHHVHARGGAVGRRGPPHVNHQAHESAEFRQYPPRMSSQ